jgi:hypothetical protein
MRLALHGATDSLESGRASHGTARLKGFCVSACRVVVPPFRAVNPKEGNTVVDQSQTTEIPKELIGQVEYLIHQSMQGHHVLFDDDLLREVLSPAWADELNQTLSEKEAMEIEEHIETLIRQPTLAHKRAYLEALGSNDIRTYAWVVKTYFNIIENNLLERQQEVRH